MTSVVSSKGNQWTQMNKTLEERFYEKIEPEPNSGCWLWIEHLTPKGYGAMSYQGKKKRAHRVSYQIHNGPIPADKMVLHKCDNRSCVNPTHLYLGTHSENMLDMVTRGRQNKPKGSSQGSSKLTEQEVKEIRQIYKDGEITCSELGDRFDVTAQNIWFIVNRRTWRHI